jgi:soluble lytic murein transglycosylase-like protein/outer membrane protein assembly factor BamD (BamD/ComL family)
MTRVRRKKRAAFRLKILILGAIALIGSYAVLAMAEKLTPEEGLAQIRLRKEISVNYLDELRAPLNAAKKNELTDLWRRIIVARKLDQIDQKKLALDLLKDDLTKIDRNNSAAGFEYSILLNRLQLELKEKVLPPTSVEPLFHLTEIYRRKDLDAEVIYSQALYQLENGDKAKAKELLLTLREKYPNSPFSKAARERKEVTSKPELREIELLINEAETTKAKALLDELQSQIKTDGPAYYQSRLVEEQLLRKLKQGPTADELLLSISVEGDEKSASAALYRSAKNAWNENNSYHALELLDQLFKRFKKSTLISEARYTEARILEELGKLAAAERAYESFITDLSSTNDSKTTLSLIRGLKRAVWLKYIRGDFSGTIAFTERIFSQIKNLSGTPTLELNQESAGLRYWLAKSHLELSSPAGTQKAVEIFNSIYSTFPRTYYGALSKEQLEKFNSTKLSYFPHDKKDCNEGTAFKMPSQLLILNREELRDLMQREIDFLFGSLRQKSASNELPSLYATWSEASADYGTAQSQIELAETGLTFAQQVTSMKCEAQLSKLAFPIPFMDLYRKYQKVSQVSVPYALGISRSESLFNSNAVSSVGALGLMQLMPATAKLEGWDQQKELTDPATNIQLGMKHLQRLFATFSGDLFKVAAAYNAGGGAVNRWTDRYGSYPSDLYVEFIGYPETNKYVRRVYVANKVYEELLKGKPEQGKPE